MSLSPLDAWAGWNEDAWQAENGRWSLPATNSNPSNYYFEVSNLSVATKSAVYTNWFSVQGDITNWYEYDYDTNRFPTSVVIQANVYTNSWHSWIGWWSNSVQYNPWTGVTTTNTVQQQPVLLQVADTLAWDAWRALIERGAMPDMLYGPMANEGPTFYAQNYANLELCKETLVHMLSSFGSYFVKLPLESNLNERTWRWADGGYWTNISYRELREVQAWDEISLCRAADLPFQEVVLTRTGNVPGWVVGQYTTSTVTNVVYQTTNYSALYWDYTPSRRIHGPGVGVPQLIMTQRWDFVNVWATLPAWWEEWMEGSEKDICDAGLFPAGSWCPGTNQLTTAWPVYGASWAFSIAYRMGMDAQTNAIITNVLLRVWESNQYETITLLDVVLDSPFNSNTIEIVGVVSNCNMAANTTTLDYGWPGLRRAITNLSTVAIGPAPYEWTQSWMRDTRDTWGGYLSNDTAILTGAMWWHHYKEHAENDSLYFNDYTVSYPQSCRTLLSITNIAPGLPFTALLLSSFNCTRLTTVAMENWPVVDQCNIFIHPETPAYPWHFGDFSTNCSIIGTTNDVPSGYREQFHYDYRTHGTASGTISTSAPLWLTFDPCPPAIGYYDTEDAYEGWTSTAGVWQSDGYYHEEGLETISQGSSILIVEYEFEYR